MKTFTKYLIVLCLFTLGCSKTSDEGFEAIQTSALVQYSRTSEYKALEASNILLLNEAALVNISDNKGLKALTIPY